MPEIKHQHLLITATASNGDKNVLPVDMEAYNPLVIQAFLEHQVYRVRSMVRDVSDGVVGGAAIAIEIIPTPAMAQVAAALMEILGTPAEPLPSPDDGAPAPPDPSPDSQANQCTK